VSSAGTFSATIPARSAIAIHIGQKITRPAAKSMSTVKTSTTTSTTASHTAVTSTLTPTTSTVQVTFAPTVSTVWGENVFVVGSIPQLGNWAPGASVSGSSRCFQHLILTEPEIALSSESYPVWKTTLGLPAGTSFHYKYIVRDSFARMYP
jgi:alpha-amylase